MSKILALSTRPKSFSDLVGQSKIIECLKAQFESGRIPHFFIIHGATGSGKTTLARILAMYLQLKNFDTSKSDWENYNKFDIQEINAANENSVDFTRQLVEKMRFKPSMNSSCKVVILDEAHQLSNSAQNALLAETEDTSRHVFYIFCTSVPSKIIIALKRRAHLIVPESLNDSDVANLVSKTVKGVDYNDDTSEFTRLIIENDIRSPGLILQCIERLLCGYTASNAVTLEDSSNIDTKLLCQSVSKGLWKECAGVLKDVKKNDIYSLKCSIQGYLKVILLKAIGNKAVQLAKAIQLIENASLESVPCFLASVCLSCELLKTVVKKAVVGKQ